MKVPGYRTIRQAARAAMPSLDDLAVAAVYGSIAGSAWLATPWAAALDPRAGTAGHVVTLVFGLWAIQPLVANGLRRAVLVGVHNVRAALGYPAPMPPWRQRQIERERAAATAESGTASP